MKDKIKSLEITFENLDWIVIPRKYVYEIMIDEACESTKGHNALCCRFLITTDANDVCSQFAGDVHSIQYEGGYLFERMRQRDITHIKLIDSDNMVSAFNVEWEEDGDNEFVNRLQKVWVDIHGNLVCELKVTHF